MNLQTSLCFDITGLIISGVGIAIVGYVGCDSLLAMVCLCVASVGQGVVNSGLMVNHLDIAPKYAGLLMGFSNTAGTVAGFLAPTTVGLLTEHNVCIMCINA